MVLTHLLFAHGHQTVSPRRGSVRQLSKYPVNGDEAIPTRQAVGGRDRDDRLSSRVLPIIHRLLAFNVPSNRLVAVPQRSSALFCKTRASDSSISFPRNGLFTITDVTQPHTRHPQGSFLRRLLRLPSRWKSHRPARRSPTRLGIPTSCGGVAWESDTAPSCPCSSSAFSPSLASE